MISKGLLIQGQEEEGGAGDGPNRVRVAVDFDCAQPQLNVSCQQS